VKMWGFKEGYMENSNIVVSFHHKMTMKRLENDEVEKQLKCKICGGGQCFLGSVKECYTRRVLVTGYRG
jgi:hypothetical protein